MSHSPFDERADAAGREGTVRPIRDWVPPPPGGQWPAESVASADPPQFRIHHLFALTAVMAVMLAIGGRRPMPFMMGPLPNEVPGPIGAVIIGWGVVNTILYSAALTNVAYGIVWRRGGMPFFHQPGHWLLVDVCILGIQSAASQLAFRLLFEGPETFAAIGLFLLLFLGVFVARLALNIYLAVWHRREGRWQAVFIAKAVAIVVSGLGDLVVLVLVILAARADRRTHSRRDGSHWCGVWLQSALIAVLIAFMLLFILAMTVASPGM
jgi:hypothetical protein